MQTNLTPSSRRLFFNHSWLRHEERLTTDHVKPERISLFIEADWPNSNALIFIAMTWGTMADAWTCVHNAVTATLSCLELLSCSAGAVWGFWATSQQGADWLLILDCGSPRACWAHKTRPPITAGIKMLVLAVGWCFTTYLYMCSLNSKSRCEGCWSWHTGWNVLPMSTFPLWKEPICCEIGTPSKITYKVMGQTSSLPHSIRPNKCIQYQWSHLVTAQCFLL